MRANVLLSVCVLMFSTLVHGASITLNTGTDGTVALETAPVEVKSGNEGAAVFSCDEVFWLGDTGEPRIPWKVVTVLLPPDADLSSVTCRIGWPVLESIAGSWQVEPMPPIATRDENGQETVIWPEDKRIVDGRDADIYERDAFWPQEQVRLSGVGKLRKWRLAEVAIPLVRYNPVSGQLLQLAEAEITVDFQSKVRSLDTDRPDPLGRSRVRDKAANFAQAAEAYDKAAAGGEEGIDSPNPGSTGYVIITTSAIQSASTKLSAFVAHKQSRGFNVQVITESTWRVSTGDSDANNIRAWLAGNYVTSDILYVLLIGNPHPGTGDVPMKMCISDHPTDYFYAELTADWDLDGDGIYGESGEAEKYFEVYTGRIPYYGNIADTDSILQKIIDYENEADVDWRRKVLLPMVPLDDSTPAYQLGEQIKHNFLEPEAIPSDRIYDETYGVIPPPEYLRSEAKAATVWSRNIYGMVVWMTHGSSGSASGIIGTGDVPNLDDSYPSATYQGSCTNCRPESTNNLCYALLKNGAIATIGATRLSWYYVGQTNFTNTSSIGGLGYQYAKRLVERQSCGQAIYNTKEALSFWRKNYYVMMLYGDPSVVVFGPSPDFTVSPTDMFYQIGPYKGPFSSISRSYTLKNNSLSPVDWTAMTTASWLSIPAGGTIGPTGLVTADALSGAEVYELPVGRYCGELTFTDTAMGREHKRQAVLEIKPRSMVAYWKLDETSGRTASDSSGNGYHGTLEGGFAFDTAAVMGPFGNALNFSHPNDVVNTGKTVSDFGLANNAAKSITAWVYTRSFNDGGIYEMGRQSNGQDFSLRTGNADNSWRVQYWGGSYDIDFSYNSKDRWVHFAHVYDGLVADEPRALNTTDRKTFKIGRWDDHHFDGIIDDVRIYNYPLDLDAVLAIMGGGCAENPHPYDTEVDAPRSVTLSWVPGVKAIHQDVYFGTNRVAVAGATTDSPQYKGRQSENSYVPTMARSTQYFWRVDQVISIPPPPPPPPPMGGDSAEESDYSRRIEEETSGASVIAGNVWSFTTGEGAGTITREVWTGIGGNYVSNLTGHLLYPDSPNLREEITSFEGPVDWANDYGTRIHGFLAPSETGSYTFWIASDDYSELWLSSDTNPANQIKIAEVIGHTKSRQWGKYSGQQSSPVMLTAGQAYYIKALHKEGSGGDNIAVAWQMDGSCKEREVISGSYLFPYDVDCPAPDPMTWATQPHSTSSTSISMAATPAFDQSGVEYYFTCTSGNGSNSGWQDSPVYEDTDLESNTLYSYTVAARDKNPNCNTTAPSQASLARTVLDGDFEPDGDVDFDDYSRFALQWPGGAAAAGSAGEADLDTRTGR
ncbi:MAG: C25 family cysteine peptidase [Planctomycetota bacterium]